VPFKVVGDRALTETYKIRLSSEDKEWLRQQAEVAGMSMAKYIRHRAMGLSVVSKADLTMLAELRRIGGLLKLSLHKVSSEGESAVHQTLGVLRDYVKGMTDDRKKDPQP
jgi:hypothetical protein